MDGRNFLNLICFSEIYGENKKRKKSLILPISVESDTAIVCAH